MSNVRLFQPHAALAAIEQARHSGDNAANEPPAGGGGVPPMDARIAKLEAVAEKTGERLAQIDVRLARIETKLDGHEKLFASKEDLARAEGSMKAAIAEAKSSIIMWVVGAVFFAQLLPMLLKKLGL